MTQKIEFEIPVDIDTDKISTKVAAKAEDVLMNDMRLRLQRRYSEPDGMVNLPTLSMNTPEVSLKNALTSIRTRLLKRRLSIWRRILPKPKLQRR